jgi:hypothetical protein
MEKSKSPPVIGFSQSLPLIHHIFPIHISRNNLLAQCHNYRRVSFLLLFSKHTLPANTVAKTIHLFISCPFQQIRKKAVLIPVTLFQLYTPHIYSIPQMFLIVRYSPLFYLNLISRPFIASTLFTILFRMISPTFKIDL